MTFVNLSINDFDFKQIAETLSTIRVAGHGLGLIGILISYFAIFEPFQNDFYQCTGYFTKNCILTRSMFLFLSGVYASGLIGLPWDVLVLWATKVFPESSSMLKDTKFQIVVFGFLVINIWQILITDTYTIMGSFTFFYP